MIKKSEALEILNSGIEFFEIIKEYEIEKPKYVTYSRNIFIPVTNACRNRCKYCFFRSDKPYLLDERYVINLYKLARKYDCKEALFTFGERGDVANKDIMEKLRKKGFENLLEYVYHLANKALEYDLLPHINAGVISYDEMKFLKEVSASMGLMLEIASKRLCEKGEVHENSPTKHPKYRLETIINAGRLRIPFTTGLLIGIGETNEEIINSLFLIKSIHKRYGNIQEVIIQNFKPKKGTEMESHPEPSLFRLLKVTFVARLILDDIPIQIPPNLNPAWELFINFGANDLGGISPITIDYINPEAPWPDINDIRRRLKEQGIELKERLAIYPEFIKKGWYSEKVGNVLKKYSDIINF